jgi:ubiquitin carboxyl-terminal hydrolase MINDY-1/2
MVARKPVPANASLNPNPAPRMQDMRQDLWSATDSDPGDSIWEEVPRRSGPNGESSAEPSHQGFPESLRPGGTSYTSLEQEGENVWRTATEKSATEPKSLADVPQSLRPGAGLARQETNPFLNKKLSQSRSSSGSRAPITDTTHLPTESFSQMGITEPSNNPWQPALNQQRTGGSTAAPPLLSQPSQDAGRDAWALEPSKEAPTAPLSSSSAVLDLPSEGESPAWDEEDSQPITTRLRPPPKDVEEEMYEDQHAWDDVGTRDKGKAAVVVPAGEEARLDDWNLIDHEPTGPSAFSDGPSDSKDQLKSVQSEKAGKQPLDLLTGSPAEPSTSGPPLPPRQSGEGKAETYQIKNINWYDAKSRQNLRKSPILVQNANGPCPLVALVNALTLTTPAELDTELYQVLRSREQISLGLLLEAVFEELMSPRRTNPDVPLPDVTELYDFLRGLHTGMNVNPRFTPTAEAITAHKRTSLAHIHPTERGELIPGTFEETREMNLYATFAIPLIHGWLPQRTEPAFEAFNRSAVSYEDTQNLLFREEELEDKLSNSVHMGLSAEEQQIYQDILTIKSFLSISATQLTPWGLEVITQAIRPGSVAILFRNDHFSTLYRHPQTLELLTLVTDAGYAGHDEIVWESLVDVNGESAEFFSGDFRLVGGAAASPQHALSGGSARPGSYASVATGTWHGGEPSMGRQDGWATMDVGRGKNKFSPDAGAEEPPLSPNHEQEDRDLALALQLQEEEEERHREEQARRRRESILSEQFIEQQARQSSVSGPRGGAARGGRGGIALGGSTASPHNPRSSNGGTVHTIPVTTSGSTTTGVTGRRASGPATQQQQQIRPLIPPVTPRRPAVHRPADEGTDDAPPSYEQAAQQPSYQPPPGHPHHQSSSPDISRQNTGVSTNGSGGLGAQVATDTTAVPAVAGRAAAGPSRSGTGPIPVRRQGSGVRAQSFGPDGAQQGKDGKDCVVM